MKVASRSPLAVKGYYPVPHPTARLITPAGSSHWCADVDLLIVPLIKALWQAGVSTDFSCQGGGWRAAEVSESRINSAYSLLNAGYVSGNQLADLDMAVRVMQEQFNRSCSTEVYEERVWVIRFLPFTVKWWDGL